MRIGEEGGASLGEVELRQDQLLDGRPVEGLVHVNAELLWRLHEQYPSARHLFVFQFSQTRNAIPEHPPETDMIVLCIDDFCVLNAVLQQRLGLQELALEDPEDAEEGLLVLRHPRRSVKVAQ